MSSLLRDPCDTRSREGVRLLARGEVEVFAASTLGKVTFAMPREPSAALLRYPDVSGALVRGPSILAERTCDREVTLRFVRYHGIVEYVVGALEGLVLAFEATPTVDVCLGSDCPNATSDTHLALHRAVFGSNERLAC